MKEEKKKRSYTKSPEKKIQEANAKWLANPSDRKKKGPPQYWQALNRRKPYDYEDLL